MIVSAAHLVHIVVLPSQDLAEQLDRDSGAISFAVEKGTGSPGYGRVAVVVTEDDNGSRAVSHLGIVKKAGARTNLDDTWVLSAVRELRAPIRLADLAADLGRSADAILKVASLRRGGALSPAESSALQSAIRSRIGSDEWPSPDGSPEWMARRIDSDLHQDHTNAIGTALMFSNMNLTHMRKAPLPGESPLTTLQLTPTEPSLIDNDLRNFPRMEAYPQREDIVRFTDNQHTLDVMNVNASRIESATGVDLIYFSHNYDSFVLVQYKRMEAHSYPRVAQIDSRLPGQLIRMVTFDAFGQAIAGATDPNAYRLGPGSTFTKFAYPVGVPLREADLTRGMYIPSEFLKRLYDGGRLKGPRGGAVITHDNLGRWLQNSQFAELVKSGWVGTSGVSAQDVRNFIDDRLRAGRVEVIAAHRSTESDNV